jgi:hypothetical protein
VTPWSWSSCQLNQQSYPWTVDTVAWRPLALQCSVADRMPNWIPNGMTKCWSVINYIYYTR